MIWVLPWFLGDGDVEFNEMVVPIQARKSLKQEMLLKETGRLKRQFKKKNNNFCYYYYYLFFFFLVGIYKKEEAHLLLKAFQIKGPADIFVSKFENDNWGLAGYVSTLCGDCHSAQGADLCCPCAWKRTPAGDCRGEPGGVCSGGICSLKTPCSLCFANIMVLLPLCFKKEETLTNKWAVTAGDRTRA